MIPIINETLVSFQGTSSGSKKKEKEKKKDK